MISGKINIKSRNKSNFYINRSLSYFDLKWIYRIAFQEVFAVFQILKFKHFSLYFSALG